MAESICEMSSDMFENLFFCVVIQVLPFSYFITFHNFLFRECSVFTNYIEHELN